MINESSSTSTHDNSTSEENGPKEYEKEISDEVEPHISQKPIPSLPVKFALKRLKVRVARLKGFDSIKETTDKLCSTSHPIEDNEVQNDSISNSSKINPQLIPWLNYDNNAKEFAFIDAVFEEMQISNETNLIFYTLHGVDYAFYDTDDVSAFGYMRLKSRQYIPQNRTERYTLHLVTMAGTVRITTGMDNASLMVGPGDVTVINKRDYYSIENMSEDVGVIMFYKK